MRRRTQWEEGPITGRSQCVRGGRDLSPRDESMLTSSFCRAGGLAAALIFGAAGLTFGQAYQIIPQTVYEAENVTAWKLEYETQLEQRQITVHKPVTETEMRVRRYTVAKTVAEQGSRQEKYTVLKPYY